LGVMTFDVKLCSNKTIKVTGMLSVSAYELILQFHNVVQGK